MLVLAQGVSAKTEADDGKGRGGICAECRRVGRDLTAGAEKYCNMSLRKRAWTVSAWTVLFISGPLESDTRHFAKIRVSQGDLRSKLNRHGRGASGLKIVAQIAGELCYNTCALGD